MKLPSLTPILTAALVAVGATVIFEQPSRAGDAVFFCEMSSSTNLPTTYAYKPSAKPDPIPVIRWDSRYFSRSGYTPLRRCQDVAGRFQKFYDQGLLSNVTTGYVNGLPVVCANSGSGCNRNNVLFTLKKGEDAALAVQKLFNLGSAVAAGGTATPLYESSADDNSITIDMNNFINNMPGESGVSVPGSPAAKPDASGQPQRQPSGGSSW